MTFTDRERNYLTSQSRGRLATVAPDGSPQNKPVGFRLRQDLGTIDIGGFNMGASRKFRNVQAHPNVSFVVDDVVGEGPTGVRFVEIRGMAEALSGAPESGAGPSQEIIRIHPRRVLTWNIDPDQPGMSARDWQAGWHRPEAPRGPDPSPVKRG
ncbi:MAG TPA: PPOX class F420-dependent oxidoreductase [Acidimicrobiales bacterium]|nr:PPOX class F420-dependent oxidoreductase [Acidimicrobiales bacterium]